MLQKSFSFFVYLCRILLGVVFLVSGFVKAIDPQGMAIKLNAYLSHWDFDLMAHTLLPALFAVALACVEFMLGIYLLLGIRRKSTSIFTFLLMLVMTALTVYIYVYNPVSDCGCFGDAVKLTNGETLAKNIVLLTASTFVLLFPQRIKRFMSERNQWIVSIFSFIYLLSVAIYSLHYIPLVDFTPYKIGTDIRSARTGALGDKAFEDFVNLWVTKGDEDITDSLLNDTGYTFILTSPRLETADDGISDRINDLDDFCQDRHIRLIAVTASDSSAIHDWTDKTGAAYPFYSGDMEQLEAMVRSNPGLLLLKNGKLTGKWSSNNLPTEKDSQQILKGRTTDSLQQITQLILLFFIPLFIVIFADNIWVGSKFWKRHRHQRKLSARQK